MESMKHKPYKKGKKMNTKVKESIYRTLTINMLGENGVVTDSVTITVLKESTVLSIIEGIEEHASGILDIETKD